LNIIHNLYKYKDSQQNSEDMQDSIEFYYKKACGREKQTTPMQPYSV
jgi:hypothetical protein